MLIRLLGKCYSGRLIVYYGTERSKMLQDAKLQPNAMQSIYQDPSIAAIISVLVHNILQSPREHHLSLGNPTGHQTLLDTFGNAGGDRRLELGNVGTIDGLSECSGYDIWRHSEELIRNLSSSNCPTN